MGEQERGFVTEGLSHYRGSQKYALLDCTIPQLMADAASQYSDREAVVFCDRGTRWSWREFANKVDRLAGGFHALGLRTGDRVGIWSPNRPEWVLTQFATARLGLILVTINPAYRAGELEHVLKSSGCAALVMAKRFKSSDYVAIFQKLVPAEMMEKGSSLNLENFPDLKFVSCMTDGERDSSPPGMVAFQDIAQTARSDCSLLLDSISSTLKPNDAINIQFTSGTTGLPKGATLSHHNIVNNARFTVVTMEFTHEDKLCIPVPLYHCFGMVMGTLGCMTAGAKMVFPGEGFDPNETISAMAAERCTALYGVPTMFNAILSLEDFFEHDLSSLRTGIMAGAPCPIETMNRVVKDMHMDEVTIAYGMTETSPVSFQCNVDDPIEKRVSTVGRVHPHAECQIVDENGKVVPIGQIGELCARGYLVMKGYWGDEEKTKQSIDQNGWMHSGDLAVFDEDGFCNIVGRVKDMIIRGGENIYPKEVEDYIYRYDKVQDVQVFGIPDEKYGEEVCAWVVAKSGSEVTEESVKEFCKGQIAHYKVPRHVRIRDSLPMTVSGKAQKFKMREAMISELNCREVRTA